MVRCGSKWVKGYHKDIEVEWCICTALLDAPRSEVNKVVARVAEYGRGTSLAAFNDHPDTTEEEVRDALEQCED